MLNASTWPDAEPKLDEHAERLQTIERGRERGLADAVIDHVAHLAAGDLLHLGDEVLVLVENGVVAAVLLGELGLVLGADRADDRGAEMRRPLAQDETDAAGRRVHQNRMALLDLEGAPHQVFGRHALEHHAGGLVVADIGRHRHGAIGRNEALGRIAPEREHRRDPVADLDVGHAGADRDHIARAFIAGDERVAARRRIGALAKVGVDVVDADRALLDADLVRPRRREVDILEGQDLGTAGFVHTYRRNHVSLPFLERVA